MDGTDGRQSLKRKRTPDLDNNTNASPALKPPKPSNHLAINYLARQNPDDLSLVSHEDPLQNILDLLTEYHGVLDRHESMAFNLGARPLGPILIKRFERLFDEPPKVLLCNSKEPVSISWLDVVEFARSKPEQFTLGQMSEGVRVCQFYTKQCRVQISQEDHLLVTSGVPQKLIPPQPVIEDEEKELGTLEILEANLHSIYQMADQVAARGRQLRHRIMARKQAVIDRRSNDSAFEIRHPSPSGVPTTNGHSASPNLVTTNHMVADSHGHVIELNKLGATEATLQELLKQFSSVRVLKKLANSDSGSGSHAMTTTIANAVRAISATPGSHNHEQPHDSNNALINNAMITSAFSAPTQGGGRADDSPFRTEMMARMESVKRGERILPPCDRCRRLHMDCVKNLTACQGCTKKHAKCSWKEVRLEELNYAPEPNSVHGSSLADLTRNHMNGTSTNDRFQSNVIAAAELAAAAGVSNADLEAVAKASSAALDAADVRNYTQTSPNAAYSDFAANNAGQNASINASYAHGQRVSEDRGILSRDIRHSEAEIT